jgi:hypothetical protein
MADIIAEVFSDTAAVRGQFLRPPAVDSLSAPVQRSAAGQSLRDGRKMADSVGAGRKTAGANAQRPSVSSRPPPLQQQLRSENSGLPHTAGNSHFFACQHYSRNKTP